MLWTLLSMSLYVIKIEIDAVGCWKRVSNDNNDVRVDIWQK